MGKEERVGKEEPVGHLLPKGCEGLRLKERCLCPLLGMRTRTPLTPHRPGRWLVCGSRLFVSLKVLKGLPSLAQGRELGWEIAGWETSSYLGLLEFWNLEPPAP